MGDGRPRWRSWRVCASRIVGAGLNGQAEVNEVQEMQLAQGGWLGGMRVG
jgi:hypothetical protein